MIPASDASFRGAVTPLPEREREVEQRANLNKSFCETWRAATLREKTGCCAVVTCAIFAGIGLGVLIGMSDKNGSSGEGSLIGGDVNATTQEIASQMLYVGKKD